MTGQQIDRDQLRELVENATPAPWAADLDRYGETRGIWPTGPGEEQIIGSYVAADGYDSQGWTGGTDEDLSFIAATRQAVPALLDMLDQAEAERDQTRAQVDRVRELLARWVDEYGHPVYRGNGWAEGVRDAAREALRALNGT